MVWIASMLTPFKESAMSYDSKLPYLKGLAPLLGIFLAIFLKFKNMRLN